MTTRVSETRPRRTRPCKYQDISALRDTLPSYWWAEVSRVRAHLAADPELGLFEVENILFAAEALYEERAADPLAQQHARALWEASRCLVSIARGQGRTATAAA